MSIEAVSDCGDGGVLAIYLEPAPYIVALLAAFRANWRGICDALFVGDVMSQPWNYCPDEAGRVLSSGAWSTLCEIWRVLRSGRYRLVHLAGWGHPVLLGSLLIAWWLRIPVTVESDTQLPLVRGGWKDAVKQAVYPLLFKIPAAFLPGGKRQIDYLRFYGVEPSKMQNARMTVDVAAITAYCSGLTVSDKRDTMAGFGIPQDCIRFLYVGRLEAHKGLLDLVAAFQNIERRIIELTLLIVGDGSLRATIEREAERDRGIRYIGRLEGERLWQVYALADIFVVPSHFEPWGLVVNEAMAAGLPVIVTDCVGCIDDIVVEEETGLIVPTGSPQKLAEAMRRLANCKRDQLRMGDAAKRSISGRTLQNSAEIATAVWRGALN